jgi:ParB family chromosome partitioning protein
MKQQRGLGKGLGALLGDEALEDSGGGSGVSVNEIHVNEIDRYTKQPRKIFDEEKLKELAESIKTHGIVQPIVVKENGGRYTIIAGERRYRAARLAGLQTVPVVIKNLNDRELMEVSLVENLQREDLNPLEEAEAIRMLMDEYSLTQEGVSERISRSRSAVANTLRLLTLPEPIKQMLYDNQITSGHARALVSVPDDDLKIKLAKEIIVKNLSVRDTEKMIQKLNEDKKPRPAVKPILPEFKEAETTLSRSLGTKVRINGDNKKGKFIIDYYSPEQMESIYEFLASVK